MKKTERLPIQNMQTCMHASWYTHTQLPSSVPYKKLEMQEMWPYWVAARLEDLNRVLKKTPNAILGSISLSVVVAHPDKRLQIGPFYIGVVW